MNQQIIEDFKPIFYPRSIAVIGASAEPAKFGNIILSAILEIGYEGKIFPVNPEGGRSTDSGRTGPSRKSRRRWTLPS